MVFREAEQPLSYGLTFTNADMTPMARSVLMVVQAHIIRTLLFETDPSRMLKSRQDFTFRRLLYFLLFCFFAWRSRSIIIRVLEVLFQPPLYARDDTWTVHRTRDCRQRCQDVYIQSVFTLCELQHGENTRYHIGSHYKEKHCKEFQVVPFAINRPPHAKRHIKRIA